MHELKANEELQSLKGHSCSGETWNSRGAQERYARQVGKALAKGIILPNSDV